MTKKDFELIATLIKTFEFTYADNLWHKFMRERLAHHFARTLKATNPNFNEDKFIDACLESL